MAMALGSRVRVPTASRGRSSAAPRAAMSTPSTASLRVVVAARPVAGGRRRPAAVRPSKASRSAAVAVEANLFSRLVRVFKANLSNLTSRFEDPEVLLDRVLDEMGDDLVKMRRATAAVMASERQMSAKYSQAQATADDWLRRAELAVKKGQDDLAREALARRRAAEGAASGVKVQLDAQRRALEQLTANVRTLEAKVVEARNKRETLKSRAAAAKSSKAVQEMVAGLRLNNSNAWAAFDVMEEKVMAMEAEAESVGLLAAPDSLEARFQSLEGTGGVEDELTALKRGLLPSPRAPSSSSEASLATATRPLFDEVVVKRSAEALAIDEELEALRKRARA